MTDLVYQFIDIEGFDVSPDDLVSIIELRGGDPDLIRLELTQRDLEGGLRMTEREYDSDEWVSDSETEVSESELMEMENEIAQCDAEEERSERLETWLIDNKVDLEDDLVEEVMDQYESCELDFDEAVQRLQNVPRIERAEIQIEQQKTDLCINESNFADLVKEIIEDHGEYDVEEEVYNILQHVSEDFLIQTFR